MADIKYYDVILKPVITEKSMAGMGEKKYTFLVHTEANKSQIKEAVEKMFEGTKVKKVNTINMDNTEHVNPRPLMMAQVMQIRFNHARLSSTVRPLREKFIISRAMDAVTIAATVEISTI